MKPKREKKFLPDWRAMHRTDRNFLLESRELPDYVTVRDRASNVEEQLGGDL